MGLKSDGARTAGPQDLRPNEVLAAGARTFLTGQLFAPKLQSLARGPLQRKEVGESPACANTFKDARPLARVAARARPHDSSRQLQISVGRPHTQIDGSEGVLAEHGRLLIPENCGFKNHVLEKLDAQERRN